MVNYNSQWASSFVSNHILGLTDKPVGFVDGALPIVLAKNAAERYKLAELLPFSYKATKLDLIYLTNHHGRSVEMFYKHCANAKHTIALEMSGLLKKLDPAVREVPTQEEQQIVERWKVYGNGGEY